eukprot:SAG22_NODE_7127_length_773_cov_0.630564_1_plen_124_part_10
MADNGVAWARSRYIEVVLSPGVRPGVFRGPWRAVLRYAGSCLVFKYEFVAPDPRSSRGQRTDWFQCSAFSARQALGRTKKSPSRIAEAQKGWRCMVLLLRLLLGQLGVLRLREHRWATGIERSR